MLGLRLGAVDKFAFAEKKEEADSGMTVARDVMQKGSDRYTAAVTSNESTFIIAAKTRYSGQRQDMLIECNIDKRIEVPGSRRYIYKDNQMLNANSDA